MTSLLNKRVLFVAPEFFGYEKKIRDKLENAGASVTWVADRPFKSSLMKAITRFAPKLVELFSVKVYRPYLTQATTKRSFDVVFVVNGQTLTGGVLKGLREINPSARFVLYLWDSLSNRSNVTDNLVHFDDVFTFDPNDAIVYDLKFRALFFSDETGLTDANSEHLVVKPRKFDLSFVGTVHSDRYQILRKIIDNLPPQVNAYWYFYLQAKWVFYLYCLAKKPMRSAALTEFHFESLPGPTLKRVYDESAAVIDIEHPKQAGLTMRTFETLGAKKKLITTNPGVIDYDFYQYGNVLVLDRVNPLVSEEFLARPFTPYPEDVYFKYSISGWLRDILG